MAALLVSLHLWLRWVVLAAGAVACARFAVGWLRGSAWTRREDGLSLAFAVAMDLQWTLGVAVWLWPSVLGLQAVLSEGAGVLADGHLRFWAVLHPVLATAALALGHAARIRIRRLAPGPARHRTVAIRFALALALLVAAVP